MNPLITFFAFVIFLFCQYAIFLVSEWVAHLSNASGHYYWSIVIVMFLLLNQLCFGAYDFALNITDDEEDEDWIDEL